MRDGPNFSTRIMGVALSWLGLGTLVLSVGTSMEDLVASIIGAKSHESIQYTSLVEVDFRFI